MLKLVYNVFFYGLLTYEGANAERCLYTVSVFKKIAVQHAIFRGQHKLVRHFKKWAKYPVYAQMLKITLFRSSSFTKGWALKITLLSMPSSQLSTHMFVGTKSERSTHRSYKPWKWHHGRKPLSADDRDLCMIWRYTLHAHIKLEDSLHTLESICEVTFPQNTKIANHGKH